MRIIGFNLSEINVKRKEKSEGKIEVSQKIDIKEVINEKISISKEEAIKISFLFNIEYSNDFAKLSFGGNILILPSEDESKEILDSWKNKKLPDNAKVFLFNFIMNKCNVKALSLEDELNLPLHIPLPKINPENLEKTSK